MEFYHYNKHTRELLPGKQKARPWPGREHWPDEDRRKWEFPACTTAETPPAPVPGKAICRKEDSSGWEQVEDHRDEEVYDEKTGIKLKLELGTETYPKLGPLPKGFVVEAPPEEGKYERKNGKWERLPEPEPERDVLAELDAVKAENAALQRKLNVKLTKKEIDAEMR